MNNEDMNIYQDDFNHLEDEELILNQNKLKNTQINIDNENIKSSLAHSKELENINEEIELKEEFISELSSPKEKRTFLENTLNSAKENEKINDSLEYLEALDENEKLIKEAEERIKNTEEKLFKQENQENTKENINDENLNESIDEKFSQDYEKMLEEQKKELEQLKKEKEGLEDNFNKSILNLLNSTDIDSLMKALREFDKALSLLLDKSFEEKDLLNKQREEKLEKALQSGEMKEVVKDFVKELYDKNKEVGKAHKEMEKEQVAFIKLDKMLKKDMDIKDIEKLQKFYLNIDKDLPHFKENYPKSYERGLKTLDRSKENIKENIFKKTKEQNQERSI